MLSVLGACSCSRPSLRSREQHQNLWRLSFCLESQRGTQVFSPRREETQKAFRDSQHLEEIVCYGLSCVPKHAYVQVLILLPWNVTLFRKRVIASVISTGEVMLG